VTHENEEILKKLIKIQEQVTTAESNLSRAKQIISKIIIDYKNMEEV
jgi:hypothetical protein